MEFRLHGISTFGNFDFGEFYFLEFRLWGISTSGIFDVSPFSFIISRRFDKCRSVEECEVRRGRTSALRTNERGKKQNEKCRTLFIFFGPNYLKLKFTANDTRDFQRKNANFAAQYAAKKGSPFPCTPPKKHAHATARTTAPGFCLGPTLRESVPPNCDTLFGDFFFKGRAFFLVSDFIRTQGSGKKRDRSRE